MPLDPLPFTMQRLTQSTVGFQPKKKKRSQSPGESYIQHQKQALIDRVTVSGLLEEDTVGLGSAIT